MRVVHDSDVPEQPASSEQFAGEVTRAHFVEAADRSATGERRGLSGLRFRYAPGARSHWHVHECEQAIIAVEGRGLVAWEGLEHPVELVAGDWWHVTPGVAHWHGAVPDEGFAHLAVTAGGGTTWLRPVTDEEYGER